MAKPMTAAQTKAAMTKWKVPVKYYSGWETRDRPGEFTSVNGIIIHHTGSDSQSDDYLRFLFVTGRPADGIPGPLCNVSTDMDGDVWVGSIGRANHAGKGSSATLNKVVTESYSGYRSELRPGPDNTDGNAHFYGNEVRFDGGQKMTAKQWNGAVLWAAAICDHYGWSALSVIGHREWTARKPDPGSTKMYEFRAAVNARLVAGPPGTQPKPPASGGTMAFDAGEIAQIRAAVQAELEEFIPTFRAGVQAEEEEYALRFWVNENGTGKVHVIDKIADIQNTVHRIEGDTDDGVAPKA